MRTSKVAQAAERIAILTRISEIRTDGDVLENCRIAMNRPGGTAGKASQQRATYAQLRSGRGKLLPTNGKKSQYIARADIPKVEAAIARGREITKLRKRLRSIFQSQ